MDLFFIIEDIFMGYLYGDQASLFFFFPKLRWARISLGQERFLLHVKTCGFHFHITHLQLTILRKEL